MEELCFDLLARSATHIARKRGDRKVGDIEKLLFTGKVDGKIPRSEQIRTTLETTDCDTIQIAKDVNGVMRRRRNIGNQKVKS